MRRMIIISLTLLISMIYADQVTIYNDNFALIRTNLEIKLEKGIQDYYHQDIPSTIEPVSVIIKPLSGKLNIFSQNYEYDLANTGKILEKYIGKKVSIMTNTDNKFSGILQFNDYDMIGLIDENTSELNLVKASEIRNINLEKLPDNFYLKPTLHWELNTNKKDTYPLEFSYICHGMQWYVTYNGVWNDEEDELEINSWVTISNKTGKAYEDSKLKLVAGEVAKISRDDYKKGRLETAISIQGDRVFEPEFEEKSFHDFHLYTLSENVTINNNQTKQLRLFPTTKISAGSKYEYITNTDKILSKIEFKNSEKNNLGMPLPRGIFKLYKLDEADDNLEFIGEDNIDHTAKNEEVSLTTGFAFDLIGETVLVDQRREGKNTHERDYKVILKNMSSKNKVINVIHNLHGFWMIKNNNLDYEEKGNNQIEFEKELKAGQIFEIIWTDRIEY